MYYHGEHNIVVQNKVVTLTTASAFNGEGMQVAYQNLLCLTKDLGRWILFIRGSLESGATPDAVKRGGELAMLLADIGCIAIVTLNRTLIMQDLAHQIFGPSGLPLCVTTHEAEANAFIAAILEEHGLQE